MPVIEPLLGGITADPVPVETTGPPAGFAVFDGAPEPFVAVPVALPPAGPIDVVGA